MAQHVIDKTLVPAQHLYMCEYTLNFYKTKGEIERHYKRNTVRIETETGTERQRQRQRRREVVGVKLIINESWP